MTFSTRQYLNYLTRRKQETRLTEAKPVEREKKLHEQIIEWCNSQWPRWQIIRARMDQRSTIGEGIHDLTVFGPYPLVLCVECKARDEKLKKEQQIWATQMRVLGWEVFLVRSLEDFHAAVERSIFGAEAKNSTVNQAKNKNSQK